MKKFLFLFFVFGACILLVSSLNAGNVTKPDIITLDSIADKYEPVIFTHERHAALAGNCGVCHHEHGNSAALPCKDCHSLAPSSFKSSVTRSFTACKNCHGAYSSSSPKMPGLKAAYHAQCLGCHRGMGNVGTDPKGCAELCHAKKEAKISKKN